MIAKTQQSVQATKTNGEKSIIASSKSQFSRRQVLQTAIAAGGIIGTSGLVGASSTNRKKQEKGFPPAGITEWGTPRQLGNGEVRTFTTATPSGIPKYHGLYMERAALEGLPSASDLEASSSTRYTDKYGLNGEALPIHYMWSQEFFIPFPQPSETPFTFLGLNWNPMGHPPFWPDPHFDIHFHMLPMATVDAITGPAAPTYDLPERYIPTGFARGPVVDERVITDMGEHMVDPTVPEMNGGQFTNTLIWGAHDPDGDGTAELTFVEPMITQAYLQAHSGVNERPIPHPDVHTNAGTYPTAYEVRDIPSKNAIAVLIKQFESFEGEA